MICFVLLGGAAAAAVPAEVTKCVPQVEKTLASWKISGDWQKILIPNNAPGKAFRAPGHTMGRWIELLVEEGVPSARLMTINSDLAFAWNPADCSVRTKITRTMSGNQIEFFKLLEGKPQGVVYLWSPHMPPSVYGLKEALAAAKKLGVELIPVLHPQSHPEASLQLVRELKLPDKYARVIRASELTYLNLDQHPPSMAVFKGQKWIGKMLPGAEGRATYEQYIKNTLSLSP